MAFLFWCQYFFQLFTKIITLDTELDKTNDDFVQIAR